ncbi:hypothetical protein BTN82_17870 [Pseudomonas chlororaphis]|uniref:TonB-dependent receptor-like beta-barrel domain-containing protein n=1 Tax=Pseudomonas chlororaphis TaxID=587753 RepID=A0A1Q8ENJ5_9PSED|nr:hypothetical protein BTN82_17870 [Pseudomonas chlororaphis]
MDYTQSGTADLKSERGKSWTYGFVWSPSRSFDVSVDYWRVQIEDLLTTVDENRSLQAQRPRQRRPDRQQPAEPGQARRLRRLAVLPHRQLRPLRPAVVAGPELPLRWLNPAYSCRSELARDGVVSGPPLSRASSLLQGMTAGISSASNGLNRPL